MAATVVLKAAVISTLAFIEEFLEEEPRSNKEISSTILCPCFIYMTQYHSQKAVHIVGWAEMVVQSYRILGFSKIFLSLVKPFEQLVIILFE